MTNAFALPQAAFAAVTPPDFSAILATVKPQVARAIRALCHRAGRDRRGDDSVIYSALATALDGFNPARGSLAARLVDCAERELKAEFLDYAQRIDDDAEGIPLQVAGGVDPEGLREALETADADPAWLARQLSAVGTREISLATGISQRTLQRWARRAREAAGASQAALF